MFFNLLIGAGALQGFFLSLALFKIRKKYKSYFKLSIILFVLSVSLLGRLSYKAEFNDSYPHHFLLADLTYFLIGPLFYFFVRETVSSERFPLRRIWFHFLPYLLHLLSIAGQFLITPNRYRLLIEEQYDPLYNLWYATELLSLVQLILYLIATVALIVATQKASEVVLSYHDTRFQILYFMVFAMIGGVALWSINYGRRAFGYDQFHPLLGYEAAWVVITLLIFTIAFFIITAPLHLSNSLPSQDIESPPSKYATSTLGIAEMREIVQKVLAYVSQPEHFSDQNLRLRDVSDALELPSSHISQSINEVLQKNFFELVNKKRVEAVKQSLLKSEHSNYTLAAIAMECGFKSSSSFYRIFKQQTGSTPKDFIRSFSIPPQELTLQ